MEEEKRMVTLDPGRFKLEEYERNSWIVNAPDGVVIDDIKEPGFWSLVAAKLRPYDRVEVRSEDGTWIAEALILGCDRTWARIKILNEYKLSSKDVSLTQADMEKHYVKWRGPGLKWSVIRKADETPLKDNFDTKDQAGAWMLEHERTVA